MSNKTDTQYKRKHHKPNLADKQILRLDVSVDHVFGVAVLQRDGQIVDVSRCETFAEVAPGSELFV
jgi:hypothetical protein